VSTNPYESPTAESATKPTRSSSDQQLTVRYILIFGVVGAIWGGLAFLAVGDMMSHMFTQNYHPPLGDFQIWFGLTFFLFLPGGFIASILGIPEYAGGAIAGAVEGVLLGWAISAYIRWRRSHFP
jgi:hypothetical protein